MKLSNIKVLIGPMPIENFGCGGFNWPVGFKLERSANAGGWIVQRVLVRYSTMESGSKIEKANVILVQHNLMVSRPEILYWEAWRVNKGFLVPNVQQAGKPADEYSSPPEDNTKGKIEIRGLAVFYEGELPIGTGAHEFQQNHPRTKAWHLHSTDVKPEFWQHPPDSTNHDLTCTWDCLSDKSKHRGLLVGVASGQTFTSTDITRFKG